ncbi:MAG: ribosomal RNA small subunit methyltransferase A [Gemmatimonadetes bacterium]|nr:ribosomal RNA small subunit methyltransferase A [Gemmatimonadota bacterium]MBI3567199.1 ribosomal RNA small subunit methyltransferase A [Gemmatimonadota bacterium]
MKPKYPPPRKKLGQHFLTDPRILARIADAVEATATDTVVEIGPGRGALTERLMQRAHRVVAIEVDRTLASMLRERHHFDTRLHVMERDVLDVSLAEAAGTDDFLVAGNVPYNITTPILFHALERPRARRAVYLVQKEVAERVVAAPGSEAYGALSVNVQALARAELLFRVAAGAFQPPPQVESAVLRITPLAEPLIDASEEDAFRTMVIGAFGMRRKQMVRVVRELWDLSADEAAALLGEAGIPTAVRPEVLSAADFARLMRAR